MGGRLDLDSPGFKQELLRTIMEKTPVAYVLLDRSYRVRFANDQLARLRRLEPADVVGRVCYDVVNGGAPCPGCVVREAMEDGGRHRATRKDTFADGSVVFTEDSAVPVNIGGEDFVLQMLVDRTVEVRLKEKSNTLLLDVVKGMFKMLEKKDPSTCKHSREVSAICSKLTWHMELGDEAVFNASLGGLLHDLGKLHVPDEVINKAGELDRWESDSVREHPIFTYLLLPDLDAFRMIREVAISHHERWDGKGYPNALRGEEIPIEARIAAVADAYSAMASDRPYRKGMEHEEIVAEIRSKAGTQFDPVVAERFAQMVEDYCLDKDTLTAPDDSLNFVHMNLTGHVQREVLRAACEDQPPPVGGVDGLTASDTLIRAIFDNTPADFRIIDESFNTLFVSDGLASSAGKPKEELYGAKCFDATDKKMYCFQVEDGSIRCPAVRAFATGKECVGLMEETVGGWTSHYAAFAVPLELEGTDGQKMKCCLEIMFDRTAEKRAEAKIDADLKRVVEVLYNLVAELDLGAPGGSAEALSAEVISFNDYLNRVQDELAEMLSPLGTA